MIYSAVAAQGRKARGARAVDLLIAAVAAAAGIPLITRNPEDFTGLEDIVTVLAVWHWASLPTSKNGSTPLRGEET